MVTVAAFPERLMAVYEGVACGLGDLVADGAGERILLAGPVRLEVGFAAAAVVVIGRLFTHPCARGRGCASAALRSLCDFADRAGWTLVADAEVAVGGDPARTAGWFARFGFAGPPPVLVRSPTRLWHA